MAVAGGYKTLLSACWRPGSPVWFAVLVHSAYTGDARRREGRTLLCTIALYVIVTLSPKYNSEEKTEKVVLLTNMIEAPRGETNEMDDGLSTNVHGREIVHNSFECKLRSRLLLYLLIKSEGEK